MSIEISSISQALLLFISAGFAGALNAIAGGGSFISFPALLFAGIPPISANATNNAALLLGTFGSVSVYKKEILNERREALVLSIISLVGGVLGSVLLLHTPQKLFANMIPYLLLLASLFFAYSKSLTTLKWLRANNKSSKTSYFRRVIILLVQLAIGTYGGYFGGGAGFLLLATLSLLTKDLYKQLAFKNLMMTAINFAALLPFILAGVVAWQQAVVMALGALLGGYLSAQFAYKVKPSLVRRFVIFIGFGMSAYFFVHQ